MSSEDFGAQFAMSVDFQGFAELIAFKTAKSTKPQPGAAFLAIHFSTYFDARGGNVLSRVAIAHGFGV
jgi:hypothetical protein